MYNNLIKNTFNNMKSPIKKKLYTTFIALSVV